MRMRAIGPPLLAASLAMSPAGALAFFDVSGSISESLETTTDRELDGEDEIAFLSRTQINLALATATPRSQWQILLGVAGLKSFGPGRNENLDRIDPNWSTSFTTRIKRFTFGLSGTIDVEPTSATQVEDTGVTRENTTQISGNASGTLSFQADPRNTFNFGVNTRAIRFTNDTTSLTETTRVGLTGGWSHRINARMSANVNSGASYFTADNAAQTETLAGNVTAGMRYNLNPRLSVNGSLGPSLSHTSRNNGDNSLNLNAAGNFGLNWQFEPDSSFTLTGNQGLASSSNGTLANFLNIAANLSHTVNPRLRGGARVTYVRRNNGQEGFGFNADREVWTARADLSYNFNRAWRASVSNTVTAVRSDTQENVVSNRLTFSISANF